MAQANDLPSNTNTAYMFALKYNEGKLEGLVNIVQKFANPNQQKTSKNNMYGINFIKSKKTNNGVEFTAEMQKSLENQPDYLYTNERGTEFRDKWGNKLSDKEALKKLENIDPQWSKKTGKLAKNGGGAMFAALKEGKSATCEIIADYYNSLIAPK